MKNAFKCPFCGKKAEVQTIAKKRQVVVHELPVCGTFLANNPDGHAAPFLKLPEVEKARA